MDPHLAAELKRRAAEDQQARAGLDGDEASRERAWEAVQRVDQDNTAYLKAVIDAYGWPGRSLVGREGAANAWLLAQHATEEPGFQRECLALLEAAVEDGEAEPQHWALLTDRVRILAGQPQLYGTQYRIGADGVTRRRPVEDVEHVDRRRAAVGLDSQAENDRRMDSAP